MIEDFFKWADRRHFISVRSAVMLATLWLTWESFKWSATFATASKFDSTGTAAVIAAVLIPVTALQKFVFDLYAKLKEMK